MKIEEIRLTEDEIDKTRHYNPSATNCYKTDERAVANTATNKAIRKIVERYDDILPAEDVPDYASKVALIFNELKNMVKEK